MIKTGYPWVLGIAMLTPDLTYVERNFLIFMLILAYRAGNHPFSASTGKSQRLAGSPLGKVLEPESQCKQHGKVHHNAQYHQP